MGELESLGLSTIKLNELNDNYELHGLVRIIKNEFIRRYSMKAPLTKNQSSALQQE
jgi:hypothetical protein